MSGDILVRKRSEHYSFEVVEDLGNDHQMIRPMYKVIVRCTHLETAELLANQLRRHKHLYVSGPPNQDMECK